MRCLRPISSGRAVTSARGLVLLQTLAPEKMFARFRRILRPDGKEAGIQQNDEGTASLLVPRRAALDRSRHPRRSRGSDGSAMKWYVSRFNARREVQPDDREVPCPAGGVGEEAQASDDAVDEEDPRAEEHVADSGAALGPIPRELIHCPGHFLIAPGEAFRPDPTPRDCAG